MIEKGAITSTRLKQEIRNIRPSKTSAHVMCTYRLIEWRNKNQMLHENRKGSRGDTEQVGEELHLAKLL